MIFPNHVRVAMESLRSTRVRTTLTTLGIIIGVLSITLVLALARGQNEQLPTRSLVSTTVSSWLNLVVSTNELL